jgi:CRISPR/Cas system CMR subunit Cmr6 (Cas7 group RAMP superfamily)
MKLSEITVEDLRANLFQTIDGRVDYIMDKQKAECKVRIDTIEENIRKINENSQIMKKDIIDNIELIKKDINNSIESLNNKINKHIENRIDWVQIISMAMPKVLITFLGVIIIISIAILDRYFDFGILKFLFILK